MNTELITLDQVTELVGISRSGLYRWMKEGFFPQPFKIGMRRLMWQKKDIEAWLDTRMGKGA